MPEIPPRRWIHRLKLVGDDARFVETLQAALRVEGDGLAAPKDADEIGDRLILEERLVAAPANSHRHRHFSDERALLGKVGRAGGFDEFLKPPPATDAILGMNKMHRFRKAKWRLP